MLGAGTVEGQVEKDLSKFVAAIRNVEGKKWEEETGKFAVLF